MTVLLRRVPGIHQFMGEGQNAIMHYCNSLVPLEPTIRFPQVHVTPDNDAMSGYNLDEMQVRCIRTNTFETKCTASFCDLQGLYRQGREANRCGCVQMSSRLTVPCIAMDLEVTLPNGNSFTVRDFASHHWISTNLFNGRIPQGTRASMFDNFELKDLIDEGLSSIFREVNASGGWTGTGWTKPGRVQDRAAEQAAGNAFNNAVQPVLVRAGTIVYHLVRLVPTDPTSLNPVMMDGFKVDINSFINEGQVGV